MNRKYRDCMITTPDGYEYCRVDTATNLKEGKATLVYYDGRREAHYKYLHNVKHGRCYVNSDDYQEVYNYRYGVLNGRFNCRTGYLGEEAWLTGKFKQGYIDGPATYRTPTRTANVIFVGGLINGPGEEIYTDGKIEQCNWLNNQKSGLAIITLPDGSKQQINYG